MAVRTHAGTDAGLGWSRASRLLHWTGAGLIAVLVALGWIMFSPLIPIALRFDLFQLHKSLGLVALALVGLRAVQAILQRRPPPRGGPVARAAAGIVQAALWGVMVALPFPDGQRLPPRRSPSQSGSSAYSAFRRSWHPTWQPTSPSRDTTSYLA